MEQSGLVKRYRITWNENHLLYITKDTEVNKYPNVLRFLMSFKKDLSKRKEAREGTVAWFELKSPKKPHYFISNKIITPDISNTNNFAFDSVGYYVLNTCYVILPRKSHNFFSKEGEFNIMTFLNGILNSNVIQFFVKHISPHVRGRYYRYKQEYLNPIPIKLPSTFEEKGYFEETIQKVKQILGLNEQIYLIEKRVRGFPETYFEHHWSFNKLMNMVRAQNLSKLSYTISRDYPRTDYLLKDLDGKETFRIILAPNEYIDFYTEHIASYVFEVLKTMNKITKRELLELKIPSKEYLRTLMVQYQKNREQIVKNEKAIKDLEKQINDLVYKLYDITYAERRIIEDYLAKF